MQQHKPLAGGVARTITDSAATLRRSRHAQRMGPCPRNPRRHSGQRFQESRLRHYRDLLDARLDDLADRWPHTAVRVQDALWAGAPVHRQIELIDLLADCPNTVVALAAAKTPDALSRTVEIACRAAVARALALEEVRSK